MAHTGSGPQIIPDRYNGSLGLAQQDRSADINVEVLAGTSPLNLQLLTGAYDGPSYTSMFLLSIPNPDDGPVPNSAWWDMTSGAPDGLWYNTVETGFVVSGSNGGAAYFEMFAWTGLYNTYQAAYNASKAGQPVYVSDSGILPCTTNVGGINPTPTLSDYLPAQILASGTHSRALDALVGRHGSAWCAGIRLAETRVAAPMASKLRGH